MVGRDKITNVHIGVPGAGAIERLLHRLAKQIEDDETITDTIEQLGRFYTRRSIDGVDGLEAKLEASGRTALFLDAIEQKEMFAKLLARYGLYDAAQQIFAHLLAKVETEFKMTIYPAIPKRSIVETNEAIMDRIVSPILFECGDGALPMTANEVFGMVYWLAEQCFIRWHHNAAEVAPTP